MKEGSNTIEEIIKNEAMYEKYSSGLKI